MLSARAVPDASVATKTTRLETSIQTLPGASERDDRTDVHGNKITKARWPLRFEVLSVDALGPIDQFGFGL